MCHADNICLNVPNSPSFFRTYRKSKKNSKDPKSYMDVRELLRQSSAVQTLWPFISGIPVKDIPYVKVIGKWISNVLVQNNGRREKMFLA